MKELAKYLDNFMKKNNYKLEYIAELTNTSVAAIGHYKTGFRTPKDDFVETFIKIFNLKNEEEKKFRLAVALDKTPEIIKKQLNNKNTLLDVDKTINVTIEKEKDTLYEYIDKIAPEKRELVKKILKALIEEK